MFKNVAKTVTSKKFIKTAVVVAAATTAVILINRIDVKPQLPINN